MSQTRINITGLDDVTDALERLRNEAGRIQADEVRAVDEAYTRTLVRFTPLGKGERPGRLRGGYVTTRKVTPTRAESTITNTMPYQGYVLEGRGPVVASPGKMLRFVINGRVFFRKRVGPAAANPFDEQADREMAQELNALPERIAGRIIALYER